MKYSRLIYLASPCFSNFERIFLQSKYFPSSIAFNVVFFVFMISQEHFNPNQNITAPKLLNDERLFISKKRMHFTSSRSHFINSYCCPFSLYSTHWHQLKWTMNDRILRFIGAGTAVIGAAQNFDACGCYVMECEIWRICESLDIG